MLGAEKTRVLVASRKAPTYQLQSYVVPSCKPHARLFTGMWHVARSMSGRLVGMGCLLSMEIPPPTGSPPGPVCCCLASDEEDPICMPKTHVRSTWWYRNVVSSIWCHGLLPGLSPPHSSPLQGRKTADTAKKCLAQVPDAWGPAGRFCGQGGDGRAAQRRWGPRWTIPRMLAAFQLK